MKYRELVSGLSDCPSVDIGGKKYTGSYLAMLVAMNPNTVVKEAAETPQLICELGRLSAMAYRAKQEAESEYRIWRDGTVHRLTNSVEAAREAGFASVCNPGKDAKGNDKPTKLPTTSAAESYIRTLPEYREHYAAQAQTEETWAVLHTAVEAAKQRTWVIRSLAEGQVGMEEEGTGQRGRVAFAFDDNGAGLDVSEPSGIESNEGRTHRPPPPPTRR